MDKWIVGLVAVLVFAACGRAAISATKPPPSPRAWVIPAGFELTPMDDGVAYRWDTSPECTLERCWGMFLVTRDGCGNLYVELTVLDREGTVIGYTNDSLSEIRPGEQAAMTFDAVEAGADKARLADVSCY